MSDETATGPTDAFERLHFSIVSIPARTAELIGFLKELEDGFSAVAELTAAMAERGAAFEQSARLGILGQHAEIGDYRREVAMLEKCNGKMARALVDISRLLTTEAPVDNVAFKHTIEERAAAAKSIADAAIAIAINSTPGVGQPKPTERRL